MTLVVAFLGSLVLHAAILALSLLLKRQLTGYLLHQPAVSLMHFDLSVLPAVISIKTDLATDQKIQITEEVADASERDASTVGEVLSSTATLGKLASERFYKVTEVTQAAVPIADWVVPWDDLRRAQVSEFVVRMWILDTGEVLQADVLNVTPANVPQSVTEELSKWLIKTRTYPALKDGHPVASVRTIEVTLEL
ncbi:MAG: hypothetical protein H7293_18200 [Candidatus Saccharibacteria bacterium]|nr:hypothetical protein [Rhodoferax sp.]